MRKIILPFILAMAIAATLGTAYIVRESRKGCTILKFTDAGTTKTYCALNAPNDLALYNAVRQGTPITVLTKNEGLVIINTNRLHSVSAPVTTQTPAQESGE